MNCQRKWLVKAPDMQTKFMLLFFGHKCLPFSLTCKSKFLREIKKKKKKKEKRKKKQRVPLCETERQKRTWLSEKQKKEKKKKILDCMKLEYQKEVLDFSNIEYRIIFLIKQILGQQCHVGDSQELEFTELKYYLELDFVKFEY